MEYTPTAYLETTIVSYLTARASRDVLVLANQQVTEQWWNEQSSYYNLVISPAVIQESSCGDANIAKKRLALLEEIASLEPDDYIETLALKLQRALQIPEKAKADALHLAYAVYYEIDYLLTWNCKHLASAHNIKKLANFLQS